MWFWTSTAALAAGLHTGIPPEAVAELGTITYETVDLGWTGRIPHGLVRVYVARTEDDAAAWIDRVVDLSLKGRRPAPYPELGDEAYGDGSDTLIVREGNVGLMVQVTRGARGWIDHLLLYLAEDPVPWPSAPPLTHDTDGGWIIDATDYASVAWQGGERQRGLHFIAPPNLVVGWDGWGRAASQRYDDQGEPVEETPTPPDPG